MMMQAPHFGDRHGLSGFGRLDASRHRAVHRRRQVRPPAQVLVEVASQDPSDVGFTEYRRMVQTLPPDAADRAFHEGVLPRARGS